MRYVLKNGGISILRLVSISWPYRIGILSVIIELTFVNIILELFYY